jgi:hypothetical protein
MWLLRINNQSISQIGNGQQRPNYPAANVYKPIRRCYDCYSDPHLHSFNANVTANAAILLIVWHWISRPHWNVSKHVFVNNIHRPSLQSRGVIYSCYIRANSPPTQERKYIRVSNAKIWPICYLKCSRSDRVTKPNKLYKKLSEELNLMNTFITPTGRTISLIINSDCPSFSLH